MALLTSAYGRIGHVAAADPTRLTLPTLAEASSYRVISTPGRYSKAWGEDNHVFIHESVPLPEYPAFDLSGSQNVVIIGPGSQLGRLLVCAAGRRGVAAFGQKLKIKSCSIFMDSKHNAMVIGEGTQVQGVAFFAQERDQYIRVGDRCLFSSDVTVATSDGHPIYDRYTGERLNAASPVIICSDVWVGRAARVNKGVRLGEGGVVAQCSIVTKSTQPHSIYGGIPAKLLRSDIAWQKNKQPYIPVPRPETPAA